MGSYTGASKGKVLVTGGSGFIASHIIDSLLDYGFEVITTARSEEKGRRIIESAKPAQQSNISFAIVEDVAKEGAFDTLLTSDPTIDYVIHTASPYHLDVQDPIKEFLDPAIKGTIGLLQSIKTYAPNVKRVVITSSSAAIINPLNHAKVYDETCWAPWTWEDAQDPSRAYVVSKTLSEKGAWTFMATQHPPFSLVVINCTFTFGPLQRRLPSLSSMNTSNHRIRDIVLGRYASGLPPTQPPVFTFVDVRDVALSHLRALTVPEAAGKRFYVVGGHLSNQRIADVVRSAHPELALLPPADGEDDFPTEENGGKGFMFDNSRSREVLGLEYIGLEKCVLDTVESILRMKEEGLS
ncbi:ketoreductase [Hypoxylon fragiforme]|uniref:ketoreductase n=1 Tax=Hypoxylon fragiforme TaxID=63214 RepID=UPI0020C731A2|nr:ketoreductase [Hypoxylon fragiforme]KAI2605445.1 ketoreductase [Hypoxylon fragiforme]